MPPSDIKKQAEAEEAEDKVNICIPKIHSGV